MLKPEITCFINYSEKKLSKISKIKLTYFRNLVKFSLLILPNPQFYQRKFYKPMHCEIKKFENYLFRKQCEYIHKTTKYSGRKVKDNM